MSLQWTVVAGCLYVEMFLTIFLIIPLLKSSTWKWIFSWRVFTSLQRLWSTAFFTVLVILMILFVDSVRTMVTHQRELDAGNKQSLDARLDNQAKEYRGQRNFYITGFALFLIFVLHRLVSLISQRARLEASEAAAIKQALAANAEVKRLMESQEGEEGKKDIGTKTAGKSGPSVEECEALREELKTANTNLDAMKKQAEGLSKEYDRLMQEHSTLQERLSALEGEEGGKKDK